MGWNRKVAEGFGREVLKGLRDTSVLNLRTREDILGPMVAEKVLLVVLGNHAPTMSREDIQQLYADARRGAGLADE
jgi:hypothetical protein